MTNFEEALLDAADLIEVPNDRAEPIMRRAVALLAQAREALAAVQGTDDSKTPDAIAVYTSPRRWRCELCGEQWAAGRDYLGAHDADCPMRLVSAALKALEEA